MASQDEGSDRGHDSEDKDESGKDGDSKKNGPQSKDADKGKPRSKKPLIIVAVVVLVGAVIGFIFWLSRRNEARTDDAYTDGNAVMMAPKVSGYVVALNINDNQYVRQGSLLLRIDAQDYLTSKQQAMAAVELARAQLKSAQDGLRIARVQYPAQLVSARAQQRAAEASLEQARRQYKRQHEVDPRATTQENIDTATSQNLGAAANLESAKAQVAIASLVPEQIRQASTAVEERRAQLAQAQAQLSQADLNVGYTEVRAPSDGFITLRSVHLGDYVSAGATMFFIVTPQVWVTANFKETQLGRMRPGDPVDLKIDAYSGFELSGHVQSIQYGSGSRFSAFPAENATGNFVKIVQRVPVKIVIDHGLDPDRPLPLGLSVSPVVHLRE